MKTNLDLYFDAQIAAFKSIDKKADSSLELHNLGSAAFTASGNNGADWDYWFSVFSTQRNYQKLLRDQKARSEVVAAMSTAHLPKVAPAPTAPVVASAPAPIPTIPAVSAVEVLDAPKSEASEIVESPALEVPAEVTEKTATEAAPVEQAK